MLSSRAASDVYRMINLPVLRTGRIFIPGD
jgi:hypothetical protein